MEKLKLLKIPVILAACAVVVVIDESWGWSLAIAVAMVAPLFVGEIFLDRHLQRRRQREHEKASRLERSIDHDFREASG
ncbi:hypothetical protein [Arthrobacter castelli]|uniref:hypothetical protein n=1 Tax=Arthrobacter castelli TaxID=271431 RepID=UPI0005663A30|nr:hypothetical protein [Arthrobacter castelli]